MAVGEQSDLAASFEEYRARVVPDGASEEQIIETRRAFYAGAMCMLLIGRNGAGALRAARDEIQAFAAGEQ